MYVCVCVYKHVCKRARVSRWWVWIVRMDGAQSNVPDSSETRASQAPGVFVSITELWKMRRKFAARPYIRGRAAADHKELMASIEIEQETCSVYNTLVSCLFFLPFFCQRLVLLRGDRF